MTAVPTVQFDAVDTGIPTVLPGNSQCSAVGDPFRGSQPYCTVPGRWPTPHERAAKYRADLRGIPPPGKGCHPYLLRVANRGVAAGLPDDEICRDIEEHIPRGHREVSRREIGDAVRRARSDYGKPRGVTQRQVSGGSGWKLTDRLRRQYQGKRIEDLGALSPVPVPADASGQCGLVLDRLYAPTDWLYIGPKKACAVPGYNLRQAGKWSELIRRTASVPGEHLTLNSLTGKAGRTVAGQDSCRCADVVAEPPRYFLVEFDVLSEDDQAAFWTGVISENLLDVAALVQSAGKSIHGWVRAPAAVADRAQWRVYVDHLYDAWLAPQGVGVPAELRADRACRDLGRLTRCPGWARADRNNRLQTLLFLKPGG